MPSGERSCMRTNRDLHPRMSGGHINHHQPALPGTLCIVLRCCCDKGQVASADATTPTVFDLLALSALLHPESPTTCAIRNAFGRARGDHKTRKKNTD
eukprot:2632317-Alexandrium_andersonii.AAC.1